MTDQKPTLDYRTPKISDRTREHVQSLDDQQLATYIAVGERMYERDAIDFARQEFSRRNLDGQTVVALEAEAARQDEAEAIQQKVIASEPLDGSGKVLAFIGGLFGIAFALKAFFVWNGMDMRGEYRKAKSVKRWFLLGFAFNVVVLTIVIIVSYSQWKSEHP